MLSRDEAVEPKENPVWLFLQVRRDIIAEDIAALQKQDEELARLQLMTDSISQKTIDWANSVENPSVYGIDAEDGEKGCDEEGDIPSHDGRARNCEYCEYCGTTIPPGCTHDECTPNGDRSHHTDNSRNGAMPKPRGRVPMCQVCSFPKEWDGHNWKCKTPKCEQRNGRR